MEQSARAAEQSYSTAVENMRNYNLKMLDMAQANVEAVFEVARQLATAKTPADMIELCTAHAHKQFELLSEQTNELTALGQRWPGKVSSRSRVASPRPSAKPLETTKERW